MTFKIAQDTWLVTLHARVRGVETHSRTLKNEREGERAEKERHVTQIVENVGEYEIGQTIVARLRAILYRETTQTPLGTLTDVARKDSLLEAFKSARLEVDKHNAELTSAHTVEFEVFALPIGTVLDQATQRALCQQVVDALTDVRLALQIGDYKRARSWVQRNKNLDSLMPFAVAAIVRQCLEDVATFATQLRKAIEEHKSLPEEAGAKLNFEGFETAIGMIGVAPTMTTVAEGEAA